KLKAERGTLDNHLQEVMDHTLPRKNTITTQKHPGEKRMWQLLDNTGMHSLELLAGLMHSLLTNTDLQWFELTTGNLQLDSIDAVRGWRQRQTRSMHHVLNNSHFHTEVHELYMD